MGFSNCKNAKSCGKDLCLPEFCHKYEPKENPQDQKMVKGCPLLVQGDTHPSLTMRGESHTRSWLLQCIGQKCVAYKIVNGHKYCQHFDAKVEYTEE